MVVVEKASSRGLPSYRSQHTGEFPRGVGNYQAYFAPHQSLVRRLTTPEGVFAALGKEYDRAHFTRDRIIMSLMTLDLWERDIRRYGMSPLTGIVNDQVAAHLYLERFVGKKEDEDTGESSGKWFHELREQNHAHLTDPKQLIPTQRKPWYVDKEGRMINYDTLDGTSLALYYTGRLAQAGFITDPHKQMPSLKSSYEWILGNLEKHGGLPAYDRFNPDRKFGGLSNPIWTDSFDFVPEDTPYPRAPVEVAASTWAALRYGEQMYRGVDNEFADRLREEADNLKIRYNNSDAGFLQVDSRTGEVSYAYMIAGKEKLETACVNQGYALFFYFRDRKMVETIAGEHTAALVGRLMKEDLLKDWGIATFADDVSPGTEGYHRAPNNFWPKTSGVVSLGAAANGFLVEAATIADRSLNLPRALGGAPEVGVYDSVQDVIRLWASNISEQKAGVRQGWTASTIMATVPLIEEVYHK